MAGPARDLNLISRSPRAAILLALACLLGSIAGSQGAFGQVDSVDAAPPRQLQQEFFGDCTNRVGREPPADVLLLPYAGFPIYYVPPLFVTPARLPKTMALQEIEGDAVFTFDLAMEFTEEMRKKATEFLVKKDPSTFSPWTEFHPLQEVSVSVRLYRAPWDKEELLAQVSGGVTVDAAKRETVLTLRVPKDLAEDFEKELRRGVGVLLDVSLTREMTWDKHALDDDCFPLTLSRTVQISSVK